MLYGNTSYLANPTTSYVVPIMTNITFDVPSVVINVITNTICCISMFCRDHQFILTTFPCFSGAPHLLKILQITTRVEKPTDESLHFSEKKYKISQKRSASRIGRKTRKNYDDFR